MNRIWLCLLLMSMLICIGSGRVDVIADVFAQVGEDTLEFVVPLVCITSFWNGILYIARDSGILLFLERLLHPLLRRLFPDVAHDRETLGYIASNVVVNMVGLGSAATPLGLKAMEGLQKHNPQKDTATRAMVTFLVLNTAGVTLLSTTLIALRTSFHSRYVTAFLPYAILSTCFASFIGLLYDRWRNYR